MNDHDVLDERALEMDRVVARELRADPAKIERVVAWIQRFLEDPNYSESNKDCLREWLAIIRQGVPRVLEVLADFSEDGRRMRQNSPFAVLMPEDERQQILAKYESRRARAHPAGV